MGARQLQDVVVRAATDTVSFTLADEFEDLLHQDAGFVVGRHPEHFEIVPVVNVTKSLSMMSARPPRTRAC